MGRTSELTSADLRFFVTLAGAPSLAAASRVLDVTRSAVTQRLAQLEARLSCRLLDRSKRRLRPTAEGQLLLARARVLLAELEELGGLLTARREVVSGHLRVSAPLGFGRRYVTPVLAAFRHQFPSVSVTLTLTDHPATADEDNWDVIVHIGELRNSSLVMVRLAPNERVLCAAPSYLAKRAPLRAPADLAAHACLALRQNEEDVTLWRFADRRGKTIPTRVTPAMASNDGESVHAWALAGLGIIVRSEWDVVADLKSGRLRRVLPGYSLPSADVVALLGRRGGRTARANAFVKMLQDSLKPTPWRREAP